MCTRVIVRYLLLQCLQLVKFQFRNLFLNQELLYTPRLEEINESPIVEPDRYICHLAVLGEERTKLCRVCQVGNQMSFCTGKFNIQNG
jgi:hypothetical protein